MMATKLNHVTDPVEHTQLFFGHNPQMKIKATTIPLQGLSEYHQWMITQDTSLEQIYLLLHIIKSRL
jgi:hypothetical protein